MLAAQAVQETARLKIEEDCRAQTASFEGRFAAIEAIVSGLTTTIVRMETSFTGLQEKLQESDRKHQASMDTIMDLLKKRHTPKEDGEESDKSEPPKRTRKSATSDSPVGARGRSRSKEAARRLKIKEASRTTD